ncbi:hypothetical protein ACFQL8_39340, partial [Streptomyces goshikiensis]|uniref:hypothetical protein n=1 Tax=Streptomyces goshikiensis TaxID=1942 RepID=UPI00360F896C
VLCVERVVCGGGGRVLEALRVVGAADRVELHYDELPLTGGVVWPPGELTGESPLLLSPGRDPGRGAVVIGSVTSTLLCRA